MLAREYCDDIKRKNKPIILSHRILILFFFTFHSVKLLVCVIMGICESIVMCYNTELVYFTRFVERNCMFP
jgi:hypothetical protein